MTNYELSVVRMAMDHVLKNAAPGLTETTREAILANVALRVRHQLNVPLAVDRTDPEGGIPGRAN